MDFVTGKCFRCAYHYPKESRKNLLKHSGLINHSLFVLCGHVEIMRDFFSVATVTNPAIWLALSVIRIFLSLPTGTVKLS